MPPPKITVVAGLDTSSSKFHLYCSNGYANHLTIPGHPEVDVNERRQRLYFHAKTTFADLPSGTLIMCEEPIVTPNGRTSKVLSLAAGAIWAAHLGYNLFWSWVDNNTWKKEVIGIKKVQKEDTQMWVALNMTITFPENELDYFDAAAICRYGEKRVGLAS